MKISSIARIVMKTINGHRIQEGHRGNYLDRRRRGPHNRGQRKGYDNDSRSVYSLDIQRFRRGCLSRFNGAGRCKFGGSDRPRLAGVSRAEFRYNDRSDFDIANETCRERNGNGVRSHVSRIDDESASTGRCNHSDDWVKINQSSSSISSNEEDRVVKNSTGKKNRMYTTSKNIFQNKGTDNNYNSRKSNSVSCLFTDDKRSNRNTKRYRSYSNNRSKNTLSSINNRSIDKKRVDRSQSDSDSRIGKSGSESSEEDAKNNCQKTYRIYNKSGIGHASTDSRRKTQRSESENERMTEGSRKNIIDGIQTDRSKNIRGKKDNGNKKRSHSLNTQKLKTNEKSRSSSSCSGNSTSKTRGGQSRENSIEHNNNDSCTEIDRINDIKKCDIGNRSTIGNDRKSRSRTTYLKKSNTRYRWINGAVLSVTSDITAKYNVALNDIAQGQNISTFSSDIPPVTKLFDLHSDKHSTYFVDGTRNTDIASGKRNMIDASATLQAEKSSAIIMKDNRSKIDTSKQHCNHLTSSASNQEICTSLCEAASGDSDVVRKNVTEIFAVCSEKEKSFVIDGEEPLILTEEEYKSIMGENSTEDADVSSVPSHNTAKGIVVNRNEPPSQNISISSCDVSYTTDDIKNKNIHTTEECVNLEGATGSNDVIREIVTGISAANSENNESYVIDGEVPLILTEEEYKSIMDENSTNDAAVSSVPSDSTAKDIVVPLYNPSVPEDKQNDNDKQNSNNLPNSVSKQEIRQCFSKSPSGGSDLVGRNGAEILDLNSKKSESFIIDGEEPLTLTEEEYKSIMGENSSKDTNISSARSRSRKNVTGNSAVNSERYESFVIDGVEPLTLTEEEYNSIMGENSSKDTDISSAPSRSRKNVTGNSAVNSERYESFVIDGDNPLILTEEEYNSIMEENSSKDEAVLSAQSRSTAKGIVVPRDKHPVRNLSATSSNIPDLTQFNTNSEKNPEYFFGGTQFTEMKSEDRNSTEDSVIMAAASCASNDIRKNLTGISTVNSERYESYVIDGDNPLILTKQEYKSIMSETSTKGIAFSSSPNEPHVQNVSSSSDIPNITIISDSNSDENSLYFVDGTEPLILTEEEFNFLAPQTTTTDCAVLSDSSVSHAAEKDYSFKVNTSVLSQRASAACLPNSSTSEYEWQFQDDRGAWIKYDYPTSLGNTACSVTTTSDDIENQYISDPNRTSLSIKFMDHQYKLNFQNMTQTNEHTLRQRRIRRIKKATTHIFPLGSIELFNPFCDLPAIDISPVDYEWFFKDETNSWVKYGHSNAMNKINCIPSTSSDDIERHYKNNPRKCLHIQSQQHNYLLNFTKMTQINKQTLVERPICRKPKASKYEQSRIVGDEMPRAAGITVNDDSLPLYWSPMIDSAVLTKTEISASDPEFRKRIPDITQKFLNLKIKRIYRIQNRYLWKAYMNRKEYLKLQFPSIPFREEYLYHGTDPRNIQAICEENIDWRLHGSSHGQLFGRGAYFSNNAQMSANYSRGGALNAHPSGMHQRRQRSTQIQPPVSYYGTSQQLLTPYATPEQVPFARTHEFFQHLSNASIQQPPTARRYGTVQHFLTPRHYGIQFMDQSDEDSTTDTATKVIFIVKVLIGRTIKGTSSTVKPPKDSSGQPYDTTVDNVDNPSIFVKYDAQEYYPEYYVEF